MASAADRIRARIAEIAEEIADAVAEVSAFEERLTRLNAEQRGLDYALSLLAEKPTPAKPKRAGNGEVERAVLNLLATQYSALTAHGLAHNLPFQPSSINKAAARLVASKRLLLIDGTYQLPSIPAEPARSQAAE